MDQKLREHLRSRNETGIQEMYLENQCPHFFAVDWREDDAHIVEDCAQCLPGLALSGQWRDDQLWIHYKDKESQVPLKDDDAANRGITVNALNQTLAPDYEIRYLVCSHGSDTAGLAVLPINDWKTLEEEAPEATGENFIRLEGLPNIFTELTEKDLPKAARACSNRLMARELKEASTGNTLWWVWVVLTAVVLIFVYFWWNNSVAK